MDIFIFGNNKVCLELIKFFNSQGCVEIRGVCLNERSRQKYCDEIKSELHRSVPIFEANELNKESVISSIKNLSCDLAFSLYFGHILSPEVIEIFPDGIINVHPAYLPFNKGSAPNVFCLLDGSPAGVTIHYLDGGIDTGPIIAQDRVTIESIDTGASLYKRLERKSIKMVKDIVPKMVNGEISAKKQTVLSGSYNKKSDLALIDEIDLNKLYLAKDLLNILRARTFPPYESAFFWDEGGRKVFVRVDLKYDDGSQAHND